MKILCNLLIAVWSFRVGNYNIANNSRRKSKRQCNYYSHVG